MMDMDFRRDPDEKLRLIGTCAECKQNVPASRYQYALIEAEAARHHRDLTITEADTAL